MTNDASPSAIDEISKLCHNLILSFIAVSYCYKMLSKGLHLNIGADCAVHTRTVDRYLIQYSVWIHKPLLVAYKRVNENVFCAAMNDGVQILSLSLSLSSWQSTDRSSHRTHISGRYGKYFADFIGVLLTIYIHSPSSIWLQSESFISSNSPPPPKTCSGPIPCEITQITKPFTFVIFFAWDICMNWLICSYYYNYKHKQPSSYNET